MEEQKKVKTCSLCNQTLSIDNFYSLGKKYNPPKYHQRCKECYKKKQYSYYKKNADVINFKYASGYYHFNKLIKQITKKQKP